MTLNDLKAEVYNCLLKIETLNSQIKEAHERLKKANEAVNTRIETDRIEAEKGIEPNEQEGEETANT